MVSHTPPLLFTDMIAQAAGSKLKAIAETPPTEATRKLVHSFVERFLGKTFWMKRLAPDSLKHRVVEQAVAPSDYKEDVRMITGILKELCAEGNIEKMVLLLVRFFVVAACNKYEPVSPEEFAKTLLEKLGVSDSFEVFKSKATKLIKNKFPEMVKQVYILRKGKEITIAQKIWANLLAFVVAFLSLFFSVEVAESAVEICRENYFQLVAPDLPLDMKENTEALCEVFIYYFFHEMLRKPAAA